MMLKFVTMLCLLGAAAAQCVYTPTECQCKIKPAGNICLRYFSGEDEGQQCESYACGSGYTCDCDGSMMCDISDCSGTSFRPVDEVPNDVGQTIPCSQVERKKCIVPRLDEAPSAPTSTPKSTPSSVPSMTSTATASSTPSPIPETGATSSTSATPTPSMSTEASTSSTMTATPTSSTSPVPSTSSNMTATPTPSNSSETSSSSTMTSTLTPSMSPEASTSSTMTATPTPSNPPHPSTTSTTTATPTRSTTPEPSIIFTMTATPTPSSSPEPSTTSTTTPTPTPSTTPEPSTTSTMTATPTPSTVPSPSSSSALIPSPRVLVGEGERCNKRRVCVRGFLCGCLGRCVQKTKYVFEGIAADNMQPFVCGIAVGPKTFKNLPGSWTYDGPCDDLYLRVENNAFGDSGMMGAIKEDGPGNQYIPTKAGETASGLNGVVAVNRPDSPVDQSFFDNPNYNFRGWKKCKKQERLLRAEYNNLQNVNPFVQFQNRYKAEALCHSTRGMRKGESWYRIKVPFCQPNKALPTPSVSAAQPMPSPAERLSKRGEACRKNQDCEKGLACGCFKWCMRETKYEIRGIGDDELLPYVCGKPVEPKTRTTTYKTEGIWTYEGACDDLYFRVENTLAGDSGVVAAVREFGRRKEWIPTKAGYSKSGLSGIVAFNPKGEDFMRDRKYNFYGWRPSREQKRLAINEQVYKDFKKKYNADILCYKDANVDNGVNWYKLRLPFCDDELTNYPDLPGPVPPKPEAPVLQTPKLKREGGKCDRNHECNEGLACGCFGRCARKVRYEIRGIGDDELLPFVCGEPVKPKTKTQNYYTAGVWTYEGACDALFFRVQNTKAGDSGMIAAVKEFGLRKQWIPTKAGITEFGLNGIVKFKPEDEKFLKDPKYNFAGWKACKEQTDLLGVNSYKKFRQTYGADIVCHKNGNINNGVSWYKFELPFCK